MSLESEVYAALNGDASFKAAVGTIYRIKAIDNASAPVAVFQTISEIPELTLTGVTSTERSVIQLDLYDAKASLAKSLCRDGVAALIASSLVIDEVTYRSLGKEVETDLFRYMADISIFYN
tara:strand:- start:1388 stop:1750 length:363 start_codon:yes stop_codon:yes gene_type:complete